MKKNNIHLPIIIVAVFIFVFCSTSLLAADVASTRSKMDNYVQFLRNYNGYACWNGNIREGNNKTLKTAIDNGMLDVGVTSKFCVGNKIGEKNTHSHSKNVNGNPGCTSNTFGGGAQCHGFAKYFSYYLFGTYPGYAGGSGVEAGYNNDSNWVYYSKSTGNSSCPTLQTGDFVRVNRSGGWHSVIVHYVSGDKIYVIDCNHTGAKDYNANINNGQCIIDATVLNRGIYSLKVSQVQNAYAKNRAYVCRYRDLATDSNIAPPPTSCTNHVKGQYQWPEDAHPHYQYYTCANCGQLFTDGSTTTMSNCSQCNIIVDPPVPQPQIGYINCPGKNLVINSEPSPGHKIISVPHGEQITIYPDKSVGNWAYVEYNGVQGYSSKNFISDSPTVTVCTNHVKGEFQWFEAAHPHYNYYKCANCGELFTDGTTAYHSTCAECNPPVVAQPEPQPQPEPTPEPQPQPEPTPVPPLTAPQVSLGSSSIKEGDSLYVSWTSAGEGAEYDITWSGTGGAGSAWNIYDTHDTIEGYFKTAGDYKLKVSASRDGQTVESGYVYFTVQPKEVILYGTVTGTNGKNLAINDAPGASPEHSNKVGRIPPGGQMKVYPDRTSGNWYWVEYNGIQGYAYKKYITLQ